MQPDEIQREIRELKRRLDLAETRLSQVEGRFEFVSGQLRDIQLYLHARFDDVDKRFERVEQTQEQHTQEFRDVNRNLERLSSQIDSLPRIMAELLSGRSG